MNVPPGFGKFVRDFVKNLDESIANAVPKIAVIVTCKGCGQKNRKIYARDGARCGKCGLPL